MESNSFQKKIFTLETNWYWQFLYLCIGKIRDNSDRVPQLALRRLRT